MSVRPIDLPELRAELVQQLASPALLWFFEGRARGAIYTGWDPVAVRDLELKSLRDADLFFIAQPMADLALESAKSLPRFRLAPEDLPSKRGFAYLGSGAFQAVDSVQPAAAVHWAEHGQEVIFSLYADTALMVRSLLATGGCTPDQAEAHRRLVGKLSPMAFEARIPYGLTDDEVVDGAVGDDDLLIRAFRSAWLLMQQPLAEASDVEPDRATTKRLRRAGHEPRPVRVIQLRRPKDAGEPGDGSRDYHHQWIVRGHWRNHWHPKRQVHRPVWIAPHVKGPEGAPMIGGEKVYEWKR
ncbi:hypothetical protein ABZ553_14955 [Streptomyces sparsogenes]|uniref:hypothetical protein n=1 Tax=Streptomyces sparsogenes TaxID=67365 RepID=UPI0033F33FD1